MPREKIYKVDLPKIYKRQYEDLGMFFFIEGQRSVGPAISIEKAMYNYFCFMGIEDFNIESSMTTYNRMKKEYYESAKKDN